MKRKTSLSIIRNEDESCNIHVTFSDKDKLRKNDNAVMLELLKDASTPEFYQFVPSQQAHQEAMRELFEELERLFIPSENTTFDLKEIFLLTKPSYENIKRKYLEVK